MKSFVEKHPFISTLLKIMSVIFISFSTFVACILGFFIVIFAFIAVLASSGDSTTDKYEYVYGNKKSENKFLLIPVKGVILGDKDSDNFSDLLSDYNATYGYEVKKKLILAKNDKSIKGVILEVDSPGGTIYGSKAIADGIYSYKYETGKPVIAHVSGIAASGAYWTVSATDSVIADYGSLVGSIGVIYGPFKYYDGVISEDGGLLGGGVTTENGIESFYFTAGKYKDFGNPYRRLSQEERDKTQEMVNNEYDIFVKAVSSSRNIPEQTIRNTIGALAYDNKKALELKLIDYIGSKEEAYNHLADLAKLKTGEYKIIKEQSEDSGLKSLLGAYMPNRNTPKALSICTSQTLLSYYGSLHDVCK